jgi:hypothetical protein
MIDQEKKKIWGGYAKQNFLKCSIYDCFTELTTKRIFNNETSYDRT